MKGIDFVEPTNGKNTRVFIDEKTGKAYVEVDINAERWDSSTGKSLLFATMTHSFKVDGKTHVIQMSARENKLKADIKNENDRLKARIAEMEAAACATE